jgi:hypothetical protein
MLLVLVEAARLRWFVAEVGLDGASAPLLRSEEGDLEHFREVDFDEQVSFLRHRFCGVLQRGCDRLWARGHKACHFVFVFEGRLAEPTGRLTRAVAEHLAEWMLNPPVTFYASAGELRAGEAPALERLVGPLEPALEELLFTRLGPLLAARENLGAWELARKKGAWVSAPE